MYLSWFCYTIIYFEIRFFLGFHFYSEPNKSVDVGLMPVVRCQLCRSTKQPKTFDKTAGLCLFYVYSSVQRWSLLIIVQRDATQSSLFIILQVHSTCFGCQPHPSSGGHKTVTTASGTGHIISAATALQRGQASLAKKHVEWTCRIINRLLCVASRWTIVNIGLCCIS